MEFPNGYQTSDTNYHTVELGTQALQNDIELDTYKNTHSPTFTEIFNACPPNAKIAYGVGYGCKALSLLFLFITASMIGKCWDFENTKLCAPSYTLLILAFASWLGGDIADSTGNKIVQHQHHN